MEKEKIAFFAFAFLILSTGGPCGFLSNVGGNQTSPSPNQTAQTHLECVNQACEMVPGAGSDSCAGDTDCVSAPQQNASPPPAQTHLACSNYKCVEVSGPGTDSCATDSDCPQPVNPTQGDCSTLAPDCGSCVVKAGCGWCKSSNSCLAGTASGAVSAPCAASDWAASPDQCSGPVGGASCSAQTNCASCLSGAGCKWCIQGSICTDASNQDKCLGGWLSQSYQCNLASR